MNTLSTTTFFETSWDQKLNAAAGYCLILLGFFFPVSHLAASITSISLMVFLLISSQRTNVLNTFQHHYLAFVFILFYGLILFSTIYTTTDSHNAINDLLKYFRFALVPFMITLFAQENWRGKAIKAFLLAMTITSLLAYAKYFGLLHFGNEYTDDIFMNRIQTGFLTAFAAFISAHRIIQNEKTLNKNYFLLFLLFTSNMIFTNTGKTGLLVYCSLATLFIFQKVNQKKHRLYFLGTGIIALAILIFSSHQLRTIIIVNPLQDISNFYQGNPGVTSTSVGTRITMARYALTIAAKHPILGTGVGSHHTEYTKYNLMKFADGLEWGNPHNQYLLIFFEFGVVGLFMMLYLFYTHYRLSLQLSAETKYFAQGVLVAIAMGCFCDSLLFLSSTGTCYVYFTSLAFGNYLSTKYTITAKSKYLTP